MNKRENEIDLTNVPLYKIVEELEKRKKAEVPKIIKKINDELRNLGFLGVRAKNSNDDTYAVRKFTFCPESCEVEFHEEEITY